MSVDITTHPDWNVPATVNHAIGDTTQHHSFELPHPAALQDVDYGRIARSFIAIDAAIAGKSDATAVADAVAQIADKADATALANLADTLTALTVTVGQKATPADITAAIEGLKGLTPGTLDTLGELATLATANSDLIATLNAAIANKAPVDHNHDGRYYQKAETYSVAQMDAEIAGAVAPAPAAPSITDDAGTATRFVSAVALEVVNGTYRLNVETKALA